MKHHKIFGRELPKLINTVIIFSIIIFFIACKKSQETKKNKEEIISPTIGTRRELTLDSIFLYAKQIYFWNDALSGYSNFSPREKYGSINPELTAFKKELFDISQLKINPITAKPYELSEYNNIPKYSYLQLGGDIISTNLAGVVNGVGIVEKKILRSNNKIIAYLALDAFPPLNKVGSKWQDIFNELAIEKPQIMIVDLRNNSGGYVESAEYIADLIFPSIFTGKTMYSEQFNTTLQKGLASILRNQIYLDQNGKTVVYNGAVATMADVDYTENTNTYKINKKGKLETINEIYFIVSRKTASASELLISCLKPYLNIKLVGETTYGKPVGFFGIKIDQYSTYLSSFLIKNANGWSDYYLGMNPDISVIGSSNPILGDTTELCLNAAISSINEGRSKFVKRTINSLKSLSHTLVKTPSYEKADMPTIMIESRLGLKK